MRAGEEALTEPDDKVPKLGLAAREMAANRAGRFDDRSQSPPK